MTHEFLHEARDTLMSLLETENFEKSVSLRIKEVGNIVISGQSAEISDAKADCAVIATQAVFTDILNRKLHPMKAVMFGKLKIAGDAKTAMKFGSLFG